MSRLITGTSSNAPATQTASSDAATMASASAISVVADAQLGGCASWLAPASASARASRAT